MVAPLQGSDEETQERDECIARIEENDEGSDIVDMLGQQSWLIARLRESLSKRDSLESALREAQKDVERLDWLTRCDFLLAGYDNIGSAILAHRESSCDLREAIDAVHADTGEST